MNRFAAAVAAITLFAVPATASAHHKPDHAGGPPPWAGTPGGPQGNGQSAGHGHGPVAPPAELPGDQVAPLGEGGAHADTQTPPPAHCKKVQRVGFAVSGTFGSFADPVLTVDVVEANRHARGYLAENDPSFDVTGAEIVFDGVTDDDASGTVGFEDVLSTDAVAVTGKLIRPKRGCSADEGLRIDDVMVSRPVVGP